MQLDERQQELGARSVPEAVPQVRIDDAKALAGFEKGQAGSVRRRADEGGDAGDEDRARARRRHAVEEIGSHRAGRRPGAVVADAGGGILQHDAGRPQGIPAHPRGVDALGLECVEDPIPRGIVAEA